MATDKVLINRNTMTGIANAIRSKNESQTLYRPGEMADAIRGIKGGDMSSVESVAISNKADLAEVWLDTPYASLPLEVSVLPVTLLNSLTSRRLIQILSVFDVMMMAPML